MSNKEKTPIKKQEKKGIQKTSNLEIPTDKQKSAEAANWLSRSWNKIRENWKRSAILGGGIIATTIPGLAKDLENPNLQADREFANQDKDKITQTFRKVPPKMSQTEAKIYYQNKLEEAKERDNKRERSDKNVPNMEQEIVKVTLKDFLKRDTLDVEDNRIIHVVDAKEPFTRGSGEDFRGVVITLRGARGFKGLSGEKEYQDWMDRARGFSSQQTEVARERNEQYQETITEDEYEDELDDVYAKTSSKKESKAVKKSKNDDDFYMVVQTRSGPKTFKGAKGRKNFEKFMQQRNKPPQYQQRPQNRPPYYPPYSNPRYPNRW